VKLQSRLPAVPILFASLSVRAKVSRYKVTEAMSTGNANTGGKMVAPNPTICKLSVTYQDAGFSFPPPNLRACARKRCDRLNDAWLPISHHQVLSVPSLLNNVSKCVPALPGGAPAHPLLRLFS